MTLLISKICYYPLDEANLVVNRRESWSLGSLIHQYSCHGQWPRPPNRKSAAADTGTGNRTQGKNSRVKLSTDALYQFFRLIKCRVLYQVLTALFTT